MLTNIICTIAGIAVGYFFRPQVEQAFAWLKAKFIADKSSDVQWTIDEIEAMKEKQSAPHVINKTKE